MPAPGVLLLITVVLIVLNGVILGKPGGPDSEIQLKIGWFIGLLNAPAFCVRAWEAGLCGRASG